MLVVQLSRKELEQAGACHDGLALFDSVKAGQDDVRRASGRQPRRSLRMRWTLTHQLWMATAHPSFFGWLGDVGLFSRVYTKRGADLGGADLYGANLGGADLGGANLGGANLGGADLDGARNWPSSVPIPNGWKLCAYGCCLERTT